MSCITVQTTASWKLLCRTHLTGFHTRIHFEKSFNRRGWTSSENLLALIFFQQVYPYLLCQVMQAEGHSHAFDLCAGLTRENSEGIFKSSDASNATAEGKIATRMHFRSH